MLGYPKIFLSESQITCVDGFMYCYKKSIINLEVVFCELSLNRKLKNFNKIYIFMSINNAGIWQKKS